MIAPGMRFGRYEVGDILGTGGFGVVHLARDVELGRELAIKFLRPEYLARQQVVQRFLQEAKAAAKVVHPSIVTVFECGQVTGTGAADGSAFIAMELLRGESLSDRIKRIGKLPSALAVSLGRQIAAALAAAHEAGIIHRDLKPDNVYLITDPAVRGGARAKILDFGVAKLAEPIDAKGVHTHSQMMLGTPRYMSPEQARSAGKIDHRSDIYSLGCILFETVAGRPPYNGDLHDTLLAHQAAPIPSVRAFYDAAPPELDRLIASMMAKSPDDRPASMAIVDESLGACESTARDLLAATVAEDAPTISEATMSEATIVRTKQGTRLPLPGKTIALIAGGLVLGGMLTYLALRGGDDELPRPGAVVVWTPRPAPPIAVAAPDVDAAAVEAAPPPPPLPVPPPEPPAPDPERVRLDCARADHDRRWDDLLACAARLRPLDAAVAARFNDRAQRELAAQAAKTTFAEALAAGDLKRARAALDDLGGSVTERESRLAYDKAEAAAIADVVRRLRQKRTCKDHALLLRQADARGKRIAEEARRQAPRCEADAVPAAPAAPPCNYTDLMQKGKSAYNGASYSLALSMFDAAVACRAETDALQGAFMSACKVGSRPRAKAYFKRSPQAALQALAVCVGNGITKDELEAP